MPPRERRPRPDLRASQVRRDPRRRGRPATLSLGEILEAAIAQLDRGGPNGLTLRGLAGFLGSGLGSVYGYVQGKDELIDRASDAVVGHALGDVVAMREGRLDPAERRAEGVVASSSPAVEEALTEARRICLSMYHQIERHPWVAPRIIGDVEVRPNSMRIWDEIGQSLQRAGLPAAGQFYAASALVNYVTGVSSAMGADRIAGGRDELTLSDDERRRILDAEVQRWFATLPDDLPFTHSVIEQFRTHDEYTQFTFGLDLLLDGIRVRAEDAAR